MTATFNPFDEALRLVAEALNAALKDDERDLEQLATDLKATEGMGFIWQRDLGDEDKRADQ